VESYWDYPQATAHRSRMMYPDKREVLFIGWPEDGGAWVLRYDNWKQVVGDIGKIYNALTYPPLPVTNRTDCIKLRPMVLVVDWPL
jgi:hypothetical protein